MAAGDCADGGSGAEPQEGTQSPGINPDVGRPGMDLRRVLVLGLLKQGIHCDYDRLHDLANNHADVRRMLGSGAVFGGERFSYRTLARNVALLTPELLAAVNRLAVEAGHELAGYRPGEPLQARCDSFAVETDVQYPTDVNLLWDALRCLIRGLAPERASDREGAGPVQPGAVVEAAQAPAAAGEGLRAAGATHRGARAGVAGGAGRGARGRGDPQ